MLKKIDLLEILKRCSFSGDKPVTDAQLAIWFSDHKKINPTTIQKMRKGERICSFGQTSFRFAFTNAAACFNEDYSFVSRINNILFDLNERGVISDYATYYKPLYEKFQRTVEIDAYARIEYVSAIVQRAFIDSPGEKRSLLSPYECVDDIISVLQKDNRSARVFKLNNDSFCIEADYTIHEDFKGKLSFYIMEDRIICCTTNLLKVNRTYEILDLICELNSFPSPTAFTISINKDNMVSMYYIINSCEVPGLRCKNVIEEAEATVCTILLRISRKNKPN